MEFKPKNRSEERSRIKVPERDSSEKKLFSSPPVTPLPPQKTKTVAGATSDRGLLGFDDIPVGDESMDGIQFRDIFRAWTKQAVKNTPVEKKLREAKVKKQRLHTMKNDLKWALQADLDEPVKPSPKTLKEPLLPKISTHTHKRSDAAITQATPSSGGKSIDININIGALPSVPKIKKSSLKTGAVKVRRALLSKRVAIGCAAIAIVIVGYFGTVHLVKQYAISKNAGGSNNPNKIIETPDYGTFLPAGKDIGTLGGWKRVSPPEGNPVFAYADKIDGTPISVSQQPLPESFHPDVDEQVAELAKSFSATDKIDAEGINVYVGTSAKGPQSTIFAKKDTLILIKSQAKISDESWAAYARSLK